MPTFKDIDELNTYLAMNDINDYRVDDNFNTLMHFPQELHVMKELINRGGDKDIVNITNATPIMKQYKLDTIMYLHNMGSDIQKKDVFEFNIFHWPKESETIQYLHDKGVELYDYNVMYRPTNYEYTFESNQLLINGGIDPFNESYFSIPGIFLQRELKTIEEYFKCREQYFPQIRDLRDICHETFLFKACITPEIIRIYHKYGENINLINFFGNNALFAHHDIDIIRTLLELGIDYKSRNNVNQSAKDLHRIKNNKDIHSLLLHWEKCVVIQRKFRVWRFKIHYIPPKYNKKKKNVLTEILYAPPSNIYKGGLGYYNALKRFTEFQGQQQALR